jgi:hypothetical protein
MSIVLCVENRIREEAAFPVRDPSREINEFRAPNLLQNFAPIVRPFYYPSSSAFFTDHNHAAPITHHHSNQ